MKDNVTLFPLDDVTSTLVNLHVSDYVMLDHKAWNVPFFNSVFNQQIVEHIVNVHTLVSFGA